MGGLWIDSVARLCFSRLRKAATVFVWSTPRAESRGTAHQRILQKRSSPYDVCVSLHLDNKEATQMCKATVHTYVSLDTPA